MSQIEILDKAKEKSGSDNRTEEALGLGSGTINNYRKGRPADPEIMGLIAEYAGESVREAVINATIAKAKTTAGKKLLQRTLKQVGAVAIATAAISATDDTQAAVYISKIESTSIIHIVELSEPETC